MKRLILTLILILFCTFFLISCTKREITEMRFVEYAKIEPKIPDNKKEFFGYIKAGGDMELSFETSGVITKINFTDGDIVYKGQVIAEIDNKILELEERENRAALMDARNQYENAKNYYERIDKLHRVGGISDNDWDKAKTEIILKKVKEENQYTDPGQTVVVFQDNRKSEAKIFVSEKYINNLYTGKEVEIKTDEDFEGSAKRVAKIKSITKTSINEGAYRVTLIFDKKYPELKDGMAIRALVEFTPEANKKVIELPITAVLEDENSSYVWLLENVKNGAAKIKRQNIKALDINNNNIVVEGLRRNDLVVIKGASEIMDGQRVKIRSIEQF